MTANGLLQIGIYLGILVASRPLGAFAACRVSARGSTGARAGRAPRHRLSGVRRTGMTWKTYALAMLLFNALGLVVVYLLSQDVLPLNPQD
jgi:K+-transporting ATPase ATPase A chain